MPTFILYSKAGCHLCEGLLEKLHQIDEFQFEVVVRDIIENPEWFEAYQYEVPVLKVLVASTQQEILLPRPSPRGSVSHLSRHLIKCLRQHGIDFSSSL